MLEYLPIILMIFGALFLFIELFALLKTYHKAGFPSWVGIVPIYNLIVLLQGQYPGWMILLLFVPIVNLYPTFLAYSSLSLRLGRSKSFGVLLVLFPWIMFPILGYSKTKVAIKYMNDGTEEPKAIPTEPIAPLEATPDFAYQVPTTPVAPPEPVVDYSQMPVDLSAVNPAVIPTQKMPIEAPVVDEPMTAQQKVFHTFEEEKLPDLDSFKECPKCGAKLDPKATICFLCGQRLDS